MDGFWIPQSLPKDPLHCRLGSRLPTVSQFTTVPFPTLTLPRVLPIRTSTRATGPPLPKDPLVPTTEVTPEAMNAFTLSSTPRPMVPRPFHPSLRGGSVSNFRPHLGRSDTFDRSYLTHRSRVLVRAREYRDTVSPRRDGSHPLSGDPPTLPRIVDDPRFGSRDGGGSDVGLAECGYSPSPETPAPRVNLPIQSLVSPHHRPFS